MVNKRVWNAELGWNLKNGRMISVHCQGKAFNITVIQVYVPATSAEEAEVKWFFEYLQDLLELTATKDVLFSIRDWKAKVESQEIPRIAGKFGLGVQNCCCSVAQSCLTLQLHGLQHTRFPCPLLSPAICSNSCPLSWWCHPTISSSVVPFSSCLYFYFICFLKDAWASLVVQLVKNLPAIQKTPVWFLGWEDPLEEGKVTHSSILV